jgi:pimeloyl-ACP methyl ester carboxylesterase
LLALVLVAAQPRAQAPLAGTWRGTIDLPAASLTLNIEVVFRTEGNGFIGTIDIPQQGATGLALRAITVTGSAVRFELASGGPVAVFDGTLDDDRIAGTFKQGPGSGTFTLTRAAGAPGTKPEPPPYIVESLDVVHGDITLAGTLTRPTGGSAVPAVVLITGSGPQDRDENVFGFKVFATLADALTRKGIAVYRYDDRGVGQSTGSLATATTADFADDALAAVAKLRTLEGIDSKRVGLLGHSEGAAASAIAAAKASDVAFIVMLAGTAVAGDQVLRQQAGDGAVAQGATVEQVERVVAAHRAATDAVLGKVDPEEQRRLIRALVEAQLDALPAGQQAAIGDRAAFVEKTVKGASAQMALPWMAYMLAFDPATALRKATVPVYAAFGELDVQVPPSLHEAPMRDALRQNPRAVVKVYPGANHLFQQAKTGRITEYATLEKAFVPGLMDDVAAWILAGGK